MLLAEGDVIAERYLVRRFIAHGGAAELYSVCERSTAMQLALKLIILKPGDSGLRFRRELRLMRDLSHPHLLTALDNGEHQGQPFIVMPYMSAGSMADSFKLNKNSFKLPIEQLKLASEVLEALAYLHKQKLLHRDVKPENVMLQQLEDGSLHAYLADFGLAQSIHARQQEGQLMGTAGYMPPEQARGQAQDARSDLYAFGALLYWLLTGQPPFTGSDMAEILVRQVQQPVSVPSQVVPQLPAELDRLVMALLEPDINKRPGSAEAVQEQLKKIIFYMEQGDSPKKVEESKMSVDPYSLRDSVTQPSALSSRLLLLGDSARQSLLAASVVRQAFDVTLLHHLTRVDIEELQHDIDELLLHNFLQQQEERYNFASEQERCTLLEELSPRRRRNYEKRLLELAAT